MIKIIRATVYFPTSQWMVDARSQLPTTHLAIDSLQFECPCKQVFRVLAYLLLAYYFVFWHNGMFTFSKLENKFVFSALVY